MKRRSSSTSPASTNAPASRRSALEQQRGDVAPAELGQRRADPGRRRRRRRRATSTPAARSAVDALRRAPTPRRRPAPAPRRASRRAPSRAAGAPPSRRRRAAAAAAAGGSTSRAVRSGSSASAVPMPMATASASARQRWTSARLSGPEIHFESPDAVAVRPSSVSADLSVTSGRPVRACLRNAWFWQPAAAASGRSASSTSTPLVAEDPRPAAAGLLGGVVGDVDDPRHAGLDQRVRAGRLAPLVRAGLERDVDGGAGRVVAARRGSPPAPRAPREGRRARRASPRRSSRRRGRCTQPTTGFGRDARRARAQPAPALARGASGPAR